MMRYILLSMFIAFKIASAAGDEKPAAKNNVNTDSYQSGSANVNTKNSKQEQKKEYDIHEGANVINMAYICYTNNANLLEASLRSVVSTAGEELFNFFVFDEGFPEKLKTSISDVLKGTKHKVFFIRFNLSEYHPKDVHFHPSAAYVKALFQEKLKDVNKVIYMDCATIVRKSLKSIWNTKIGEKYAAVVPDVGLAIENEIKIKQKDANNPKKYESIKMFFSDKFLVLNLEALRKIKFKELYQSEQMSNSHHVELDAGILNSIFSDKVVFLPNNVSVTFETLTVNGATYKKYMACKKKTAIQNPTVVHFENYTWNNATHPYIDDFLKYIKLCSSGPNQAVIDLSTINMALIANNENLDILAKSVSSILYYAADNEILNIYCLGNNFTDITKKKIEKLKKIRTFNINYVRIDTKELANLSIKEDKNKYLKAVIPNFIKDVDRVIFLDNNLIVCGPLGDLYKYNMGNNVIGAVRDYTKKDKQDSHNFEVILFSAKAYRDAKMFEACRSIIASQPGIAEKDLLEKLFDKKTVNLPMKWNVTQDLINMKDDKNKDAKNKEISGKELSEVEAYPGIINFNGNVFVGHPFEAKDKFFESLSNVKSKKLAKIVSKNHEVMGLPYSHRPTKISIVYAVDNESMAACAASIVSILKNAHATDSHKFYILTTNVPNDFEQKIKALSAIKDFESDFIKYDISGVLEKSQNKPDLARKLVADVHKFIHVLNAVADLDKVIFLDPNTIARTSLQELYNTNLEDKIAVVVQHQGVEQMVDVSRFYGRNRYEFRSYFNSGVLLLNVKKCITENIPFKLLYELEYKRHQQAIRNLFNVVFDGNVIFIEPKWNATYHVYAPISKCFDGILRDNWTAIKIAQDDPSIINFEDDSNIGSSDAANPLIFEFLHYLILTPFQDMVSRFNLKPRPIIQIKEIEVPKVIIQKETTSLDKLAKWLFSFFKKIPNSGKNIGEVIAVE